MAKKKGEKVVIYARSAASGKGGAASIEAQNKVCRKYAIKNGFTPGLSLGDCGSGMVRNPGLDLLLEYCKENKGQIRALLVSSRSRLSRSVSISLGVRSLLSALGIELISAAESVAKHV